MKICEWVAGYVDGGGMNEKLKEAEEKDYKWIERQREELRKKKANVKKRTRKERKNRKIKEREKERVTKEKKKE